MVRSSLHSNRFLYAFDKPLLHKKMHIFNLSLIYDEMEVNVF